MAGILDQLSGGGERWEAWNEAQRSAQSAEMENDGLAVGETPDDGEPAEAEPPVESLSDPAEADVPEAGASADPPSDVSPIPDDTDATEVLPPFEEPRPDEDPGRPRRPSSILGQLASRPGQASGTPVDAGPSAIEHLEDKLDDSFDEDDRLVAETVKRSNPFTPHRIKMLAAVASAVAVIAGLFVAVPRVIEFREAKACDVSHVDAVAAVRTLEKNVAAAKTYKVSPTDGPDVRKDIGKLSALASGRLPSVEACPAGGTAALKSAMSANSRTVDKASSISSDMASLVARIDKGRGEKAVSDARLVLEDRMKSASDLVASSKGKTEDDKPRTDLQTALKAAEKAKGSKDASKLKSASESLQNAIDKVNASISARKSREDRERREREEEERKSQETARQQEEQSAVPQVQPQQTPTYTPQYQAPRHSYTTPRRQAPQPSAPQMPTTPANPSQPAPSAPANPGNNGVIM